MSLKRGQKGEWRGTPFGVGFERQGEAVDAVEMWKSQQRFLRAVGTEGNRFLVFLCFHPTGISTALRSFISRSGDQALRLARVASSFCLARCIFMADSVSVCALANRSSSIMLTPVRR